MAAEENVAIARRFLEEVVNQGNLAAADELVTVEALDLGGAYLRTPTYRASVKRYFTELRNAFPDIKVTVEDQIAQDDKVVLVTRWHGTHQESFLDIPATGKPVTWTEISINYIRDGKIVNHLALGSGLESMK